MSRLRRFSVRLCPLLIALLLWGCMGPPKLQRLDRARVAAPEREMIAGVTTIKGESITFDAPRGFIAAGVVHGVVAQAAYSIPVDQVQQLWVMRRGVSAVRTAGLVVGITLGLVGAAAITLVLNPPQVGCPFVYSWNGREFVFEGETFGGSVTKGMERDDLTELPHLAAQDGAYRIALTNEMAETEYFNHAELWVADHPRNTRVIADDSGRLRLVSALNPPVTVRTNTSEDLLSLLSVKDAAVWAPTPETPSRTDVVMTFPLPAGTSTGNFVVSGGTAPWGIQMITELFSLYGNQAEQTIASLDAHPRDVQALQKWSAREGVYMLPVWVKEPSGWHIRGTIPGGGNADRLIPLDLSRVRGSEVQIRIQPPNGFWSFDSFAMDYTPDTPIILTKIPTASAGPLSTVDDSYYVAKQGDRKELAFPAPPIADSAAHSVFLHSQGYYRPDLNATGQPDTKTLHRIFRQRDGLLQFAAKRFAEQQKVAPRT